MRRSTKASERTKTNTIGARSFISSLKSFETATSPVTRRVDAGDGADRGRHDRVAERRQGLLRLGVAGAFAGERNGDQRDLAVRARLDGDRILHEAGCDRLLAEALDAGLDGRGRDVVRLDRDDRGERPTREGGLHPVVGLHDRQVLRERRRARELRVQEERREREKQQQPWSTRSRRPRAARARDRGSPSTRASRRRDVDARRTGCGPSRRGRRARTEAPAAPSASRRSRWRRRGSCRWRSTSRSRFLRGRDRTGRR